ncbi:MAG TPA: KH domain-containing protein [Terriglobales bacterium]|nr:KH domain-containing protein [Terriglobales bacterium]
MTGEPGGDMRALVEQMAKALVDEPDQVAVNVVEKEGDNAVLELRVAPSDLGKVIGKQGRTARSMRTILGAAGMKLQKRFTLEILE